MRLYPSFMVCAVTVSLCSADWVELSGYVRDWSTGQPLRGVVARLARGGLVDTTNDSGAFDLTGTTLIVGTTRSAGSEFAAAAPVLGPGGRIGLSLAQPGRVSVAGIATDGRQLYKDELMLPAGQHSLPCASMPRGVVLYRVRVNGTDHILRQVHVGGGGGTLAGRTASAAEASTPAKSARAYFDTIVVAKEGYQSMRVALFNALAQGIAFEMKATNGGTITDADGNVYKVIRIGTQFWMTENLKTTKYRDGSAIPLVTENAAWSALSAPGFCWYDNSEAANKKTYGALYNWHAVNTKKLAPAGWHVATDSDWVALATSAGGSTGGGGKLKEPGTTHWAMQIVIATNDFGFTALPGGMREETGAFVDNSARGYWWTATANDATTAWYRTMYDFYNSIFRGAKSTRIGYSVRCIRDLPYTPPRTPDVYAATPGDGCVTVNWNETLGATRYTLYYRPGVTVDTLNGTPILDTYPPYKVTGLVNGTQYAFAVSASDGTLSTPSGKWMTATPK